MVTYCRRCGFSPCICLKHKGPPPPRCAPPPPNPLREIASYYAFSAIENRLYPNTSNSWYRSYYGESKSLPIRYLLNQMCRENKKGRDNPS